MTVKPLQRATAALPTLAAPPAVVALLSEAIISLGALVEAILLAYLLLTHGLSAVAPAWPALLTRLAHLLIWPLARLTGQTPSQADGRLVLLGLLLYLAATIIAVGALNLLVRSPTRETA